MRVLSGALALALLSACRTPAGAARAAPPLGVEGEVLLYLQPLPSEAERLEIAVSSVAALAPDGAVLPLEVVNGEVSQLPPPRQRLLARGRLPPGGYAGFLVGVGRATLARPDGKADLLVPGEPTRIEAPFAVARGRATVLWASLLPRQALGTRYGFDPFLSVAPPPAPVPDLVGYCTNAATNDVTVFDRVRHQVVDVIAVGQEPRGVALDPLSLRAFVAASAEGEVEVIDVAEGRIVGSIRLDPGDSPWDVGLTPDGRVLAAVNRGSSSVAFLDPVGWVLGSRVRAGDAPTRIVVGPSAKRAFVLDSGASAITVLDLDYGSVVGTVATESEPLRAALDRTGSVLYVALRGSPYVAVLSTADLSPAGRVYVGPGAAGVAVDPRTDRLYVGVAGQSRVDVFEPASFTRVGLVEVPGPVTEMVVLRTERVMLALMPEEQAIAAIDLTGGRVLSVFDVGREPHGLAAGGAGR
jgi:hypothetical protein